MSQYTPVQRQFMLDEIEKWRKEDLISEADAQILGRRYSGEPEIPIPAPMPPPSPQRAQSNELPVQSTLPRPTLSQTLLSEASIKIALYLGAFFVIAAALILAALVATLRLPVLLGISILFGAGALALKKRLAQPSFILWLVFSALLPISAGVEAQLLSLSGRSASIYWMIVLALMAGLWSFSTWLYRSRFFSLAAFASLASAAWFLADIFKPDVNLYLFTLAVAGIVGLAGSWLLKRWQPKKFYQPLFVLVQLFELGIFYDSAISIFLKQFNYSYQPWWMFGALTWITGFIFYVLSDLLIPFPFFPILAAGALIPVAWLALNEYNPSATIFSIGWGVWGGLLLLGGEIASLLKSDKIRRFGLPITLAGIPVVFVAGILGLNENEWLGLEIFAVFSVLFTLLQIRQGRWWVWLAGCAVWLMTYFSIINLSALQKLNIAQMYILTGAILPLVVIDWLFRGGYKDFPQWRWPQRGFALILLGIASMVGLATGWEHPLQVSISFGILALVGLIYALRFRLPKLQWVFTAYLPLASLYALNYAKSDLWLPVLTGEAIGFYLVGYVLAYKNNSSHWSASLRWSGLALGGLLSLCAFADHGAQAGWYVGILGILFVIETLARLAWLEPAVDGLYVLALVLLLLKNNNYDLNQYLMGASVIILGLDLFFMRAIQKRSALKLPLRVLGWLTALVGNWLLLVQWQNSTLLEAEISATYAILFLIYALLYRIPRLGYVYFAALPITVLIGAHVIGLNKWTGILILLALLYYAVSFLDKPAGWGLIRRQSGIALASLVAVSAPFEHSGLWGSLPVAIAATLWAVEAFRRRNVWLGFPANGLYLMAYFMILFELKVDQPQFYSVGAALLGILMHYLLLRSGADFGAFVTGMVSQLVLLGTTYIQMVATNSLSLFAALFFQSIVVLIYGLVIRSRSLVFTPIIIVVIGIFTVVFSLPILRGMGTVILIGCTGILFILLGILAVMMRERLTSLRDRLSDWKA